MLGTQLSLRSTGFLSMLALFILSSILVTSGITNQFDNSITEIIFRSGNASLDVVMIVFTTSADLFPIYFAPLIIISVIFIIKKRSRRIGAILLITLAITTFATAQIKAIIDRERPEYEFKPRIGFEYKPEYDSIGRYSSAFPSGHAARSAAFAYIIAYLLRDRKISLLNLSMLMWIFPLGVGISRIYIGAHYPMDIIAGISLGIVIAHLMCRLLKIDLYSLSD